ncbi:cation:proton antiporter [Spongiactinospora sp. 9N601]|uniref:cation:proton antiporter n=1 Tax=Spongiactinospora sp. 9N601 TaxID=3375149 RepID=UPI0037A5ACB9
MTSRQVVLLLLDLALIIGVARSLGAVAERLGQPPVIGEVLAGVLVGPSLFGAGFSEAVFPGDIRPFLAALGNVGVAMFMFVVGLELDRTLLRGRGPVAVTVSLSSLLVPFTLGAALAALGLSRHQPGGNEAGFVLFIGAAMAVTAFPVLARILTDRRMHRTELGGLALTCAAIGDVLAWSLLVVVVVLSGGGGGELWLITLLPVYAALMFWGVRPLLRRFLAATSSRGPVPLTVTLAGVLVSGAVTEWIGLHFLFGAFLFGAVVPRDGTERLREEIFARVGEFNATLLLPVFFVVAGLNVDLSGIGTAGLVELLLVLLVAIAGKFGGAFAGARLHRLPVRQSAALATLMNTRGLTELIILSVGLRLGVLDRQLYSIMVVMAVVTTAMAGPLLRVIYPQRLIEIERDHRYALKG